MKYSFLLFVALLSSSSAFGSPAPTASSDCESPTEPLPPGVLTSSQHSDEWKITNALSAAPAAIAKDATVIDWDIRAENAKPRILRQGSNGWTCMPDTPGRPQHDPACMDETMMKWMTAVPAGRKPNIDRVGLAYMLLGEAGADLNNPYAKAPPPGKDWYYAGPHLMIVLPDACKDALQGINRDVSNNMPYVVAPDSSSPLWVIPVAKAGERIKAYVPDDEHQR
jgi:hypothetical protein